MREFCLILAAALVSSLLGAGFGWLIGHNVPEIFDLLAPLQQIKAKAAVGAALGAIAGLLLGAGTMAAGLLIAALKSRPWRTP
jgi:membrane protein YqaA with SNARE-associated domain